MRADLREHPVEPRTCTQGRTGEAPSPQPTCASRARPHTSDRPRPTCSCSRPRPARAPRRRYRPAPDRAASQQHHTHERAPDNYRRADRHRTCRCRILVTQLDQLDLRRLALRPRRERIDLRIARNTTEIRHRLRRRAETRIEIQPTDPRPTGSSHRSRNAPARRASASARSMPCGRSRSQVRMTMPTRKPGTLEVGRESRVVVSSRGRSRPLVGIGDRDSGRPCRLGHRRTDAVDGRRAGNLGSCSDVPCTAE